MDTLTSTVGHDVVIDVDPETDTLRAACRERADVCEWTLETKWSDTPLHRRLIERAAADHHATPGRF